MWLDHPYFIILITNSRQSIQVYRCPIFILQQKLKLLKLILKLWNANVFGNVTEGFTDERYRPELQAHFNLSHALLAQRKTTGG